MRKIIKVALSLAMVVAITACGKEKVQEPVTGSDTIESYQSSENEGEATDTPASNDIGDDVSGENTKNQEETKGNLFSIHTVNKYPKGYRDTTDQAADEKDEDARPKLSNKVDNMEQYETILLGASDIIRTS